MMNEQERLARRALFGEAADAYDTVRPGYPTALTDRLQRQVSLTRASKVLEIGCGTGQATRNFLACGCQIVCLEPGVELAARAAQNLSSFAQVDVQNVSFEAYELTPASFDLILAATSFHWVDPAVRYTKTSWGLRPGGTLAMLTNTHPQTWTGFFERVQDVYDAIAPEMVQKSDKSPTETFASDLADELRTSGLFTDLTMTSEHWTRRYTRDDYLRLLNTFSPHRRLPVEQRERLFDAIGALIDDEFAGVVVQPYVTTLCTGCKAAG